MGKLLKIILSLAGTLIALVVIAAIVLPLIVDPNDYKQEIMTAVQEKTGRTLQIDGDIALSVFPWLGLDIGSTRLGNAAGFDEPDMASIEAVQLRVKLLPLLKKQLEVDTVKLTGMQLNLAKNKSGTGNWEDLSGSAGAKPEKDAGESGDSAAMDHLAIGGIEIRDARLVWDDRQSGAHYAMDDLSLVTGAVEEGKPFDLNLGFTAVSAEPDMNARISLDGQVELASKLQAIHVKGAILKVDASGSGLPGGKLNAALHSDIAVDLQAQTLSLPDVVLEALGMKLNGTVAGSGIKGDAAKFNGRFTVADFSPRDVLKALGQAAPVTTDSAVLGKAGATLVWDASPKHFSVSDLRLQLDDTHVTGTLRVDSFAAPAIGFNLAVDSIDVDRYLPPPPAEGTAGGKATAADSTPPDLSGLRTLNLNGKVTVKNMKASGLTYSNAELQVKAKDGVVRLYPYGAQLYGGSYNGDVTLDARNKTPRISVNEKVTNVQAGPLLKDLLGEEKLLGTANITAKFSGSGSTPEELRRTVNGDATFSFTDGAVKGVNIAALIRKAKAAYKGQQAPADNEPNQTDFAVMSGTAHVTNGLLTNDDLSLQSPLLRIAGKGQTHLAEETIDYMLTAKFVGSLEGQGGKGLEDLKGLEIPVKLGGTWSSPTYKPDVAGVLTSAAKEKVKEKVDEKVEEKKQELQEKIEKKLGDKLLKGLFK